MPELAEEAVIKFARSIVLCKCCIDRAALSINTDHGIDCRL